MKASLAYIDDVMDKAIRDERKAPKIADADKAAATQNAKKLIGGFRVHDHEAERKAIDALIERRHASIRQFRADRIAVRKSLDALGITPLAICPVGAWYQVLKGAGLYVLTPDAQNRIQVSRKAFEGKSEKTIDDWAEKNWADMLKLLMPDNVSLSSGGVTATVILPDPPADVVDILCKAQGLKLTVAAVPEAIGFAEKPSALMKSATANPKDVWAREQGYEDYQDWLKRDPIIFTEHGSAAAIIAQFGDFPIEMDVVDSAVKSNDLLAIKPVSTETITTASGIDDMYQRRMWEQMARQDSRWLERETMDRQRRAIEQQIYAQALSTPPRVFDSSSWTGR